MRQKKVYLLSSYILTNFSASMKITLSCLEFSSSWEVIICSFALAFSVTDICLNWTASCVAKEQAKADTNITVIGHV